MSCYKTSLTGKIFLTGAVGSTLAFSPVLAQSTGDAFLDAVLNGQQEVAPEENETPAQQTDPSQSAENQNDEQESASAGGVLKPSVSSDKTKLLSEVELNKEFYGGSGVFANERDLEGKKITQVSIKYLTSNRTVDTERLKDMVSTCAGMKYSSTRINSDLERLIKKGLVDPDTRVAVEEQAGGVHVIFEVSAAELLGGVGFRGNHEFTENELSEETKLVGGHVLSDKNLSAARANIIKTYQEARYPDTEVKWQKIKTARPEFVDLLFDVKEGPRVNMTDISFVGNKYFDSKQLRTIMKTKEKGLFTWITKSGRIDREQLEDDLAALKTHYQNHGFLRMKVRNVEYANYGKPNDQKLHMKIFIDEGPRYVVNRVSFGPMKVFTQKELEPGLSMLDGDIYSLQKVVDDVTMVRSYYGSRGYADAQINPDIQEAGIDSKGRRLINIRYDVEEGSPYRVGRVNLKGNTKTKPHVILRELPLKSGDNLNSVDLETSKKRLDNLGYFDAVNVSQSASATPGYRDINILVHEKQTGSLTFGVAFSTVENVYLYTTITQSNFDITDWNSFVGGGQRLTVSGKLGTEYQAANISLLEPWFLDRKLQLGTELYFSKSTYMSDYYDQRNYGFSVFLRKAVTDLSSVKLEYRLERYELDATGEATRYFRERCGEFDRSHVEISYDYDTRDAVIMPRKGGNIQALLGWTTPGSTVQTYNVGLNASKFWNLAWDTIFSIKAGAATIDTTKGSEEVPLFERCYLGGQNNLRGFRYRDVGYYDPAVTGDETAGGRSSFYVQFEYTVPIVESVRLAVFYDAGFVNQDAFDFSAGKWATDYGIGLRLNLPIGPLAIDYAIPVQTNNAIDDGGQFQFYVNYQY